MFGLGCRATSHLERHGLVDAFMISYFAQTFLEHGPHLRDLDSQALLGLSTTGNMRYGNVGDD